MLVAEAEGAAILDLVGGGGTGGGCGGFVFEIGGSLSSGW